MKVTPGNGFQNHPRDLRICMICFASSRVRLTEIFKKHTAGELSRSGKLSRSVTVLPVFRRNMYLMVQNSL